MVIWVIISIMLLGGSFLIKRALDKQSFIPEYGKRANFNLLGTFIGLGFSFYGSFRKDGESEVSYIFLCFYWMPIIPIGCRRVSECGTSGIMPVISTTYKIYSKERWELLEILQIYLCYWGGLSSVLSILVLLLSIASTPYVTKN